MHAHAIGPCLCSIILIQCTSDNKVGKASTNGIVCSFHIWQPLGSVDSLAAAATAGKRVDSLLCRSSSAPGYWVTPRTGAARMAELAVRGVAHLLVVAAANFRAGGLN